MNPPLAAIVLAAGASSRMGSPKALLRASGGTFLGRVVGLAQGAGLHPIRIVAGADLARIEAAHPECRDWLVPNPSPELGQIHSLRLGLAALPRSCGGAMVFLVDHPWVEAATVAALIDAFTREGKAITVPVHGGRRGHPVLFARPAFEELSRLPEGQGASFLLRSRADWVAEVGVEDPGILADVDTPADLARERGDVNSR